MRNKPLNVVTSYSQENAKMEAIQLTVDESLLAEIDQVTRSLGMTRASFLRLALELALRNQETIAREQQHAHGYSQHTVKPGEFDEWEPEQVWSEP
jgi:metal-responsive CopG/Arc/MetJ family transcriptional regulator